MNWLKVLKQLARRKGAARINAEAPTRHHERAMLIRWGETATLKREPVDRRERSDE